MASVAAPSLAHATPFPSTQDGLEDGIKSLALVDGSTPATLSSLLPDGLESNDTHETTVEILLSEDQSQEAPVRKGGRLRRISLGLFRRGEREGKGAQSAPTTPTQNRSNGVVFPSRPVSMELKGRRSSFDTGSAFHEQLGEDEEEDEEEEDVESTSSDDVAPLPTPESTADSAQSAPLPTIQRASMEALKAEARKGDIVRRVSFSPSTDLAGHARAAALAESQRKKKQEEKKRKKEEKNNKRKSAGLTSASAESLVGTPEVRARRSSLALLRPRVSLDSVASRQICIDDAGIHTPVPPRKRRLSTSSVSKKTAQAHKHARALEQLVNASSSSSHSGAALVVGGKAKGKGKKHGDDGVSKRQVKKLKKALMDEKLAHGIIGELRAMEVAEGSASRSRVLKIDADKEVAPGSPDSLSPAQVALQAAAAAPDDVAIKPGFGLRLRRRLTSTASAPTAPFSTKSSSSAAPTPTRSRPAPRRAVCLDCDEAEAERRHEAAVNPQVSKAAAGHSAKSSTPQTDLLLGLGNRMKALGFSSGAAASSVSFSTSSTADQVAKRDLSALPSLQSSSTGPGGLIGVTALNLLTSPPTGLPGAAMSAGLDASGALPALSSLSHYAVRASGSDLALHPPLDRMALFVHWWGYELTLPAPTMSYLGTARSVSGAFLNFLSTMVVTGGVPEMLPFIRYISMAIDVEFKAIQQADRGKGVVLAATWVIPLALVPRAWDFEMMDGTAPQPPSTTPGQDTGSETPPPAGARKTTPVTRPRKSSLMKA